MASAALMSESFFLGESLGFWVQTTFFSLSALGAVYAIYHNGLLARRRATIDHIIHQKSDQDLLFAIDLVHELHRKGETFSKFYDQHDSKERRAILKVLNNHEFVALAIRRKAFDERIYKELQCSNFIKVWDSANGLACEIRKKEDRQTLFQEFEWLAKRWKKNRLKRHE